MTKLDNSGLGPLGLKLQDKLTKGLTPEKLVVLDESHKHAGHAGNPDGDRESHFHVQITASVFAGKNRLARQRMVNALLADELKSGAVHALSMELADTI